MRKSAKRVSEVRRVRNRGRTPQYHPIGKKPTGIAGFDQITDGGLPVGRLTAVIGGPGMGKSLFALQTLVNRLRTAGEPGLFVTFEEPVDRVRVNVAGLDWAFDSIPGNQLALIDARLPADTVQAGASTSLGCLPLSLRARPQWVLAMSSSTVSIC